ncbi:unnamed protein product [Kuraishia capsulata CBS 1993]|uniref:Uncharacterized protein n=1 Tax=Kuraishia capsulata CBS 1993 TaxID=1382522 RepID=W6MVI9_9ASCO|nr:uncharacterized protein KUCA_T00002291001 [Kuraishia capsulata CBS 1993]CDK26320.1 unnamed protein product [Kuraishia capsulata CBS 1993]
MSNRIYVSSSLKSQPLSKKGMETATSKLDKLSFHPSISPEELMDPTWIPSDATGTDTDSSTESLESFESFGSFECGEILDFKRMHQNGVGLYHEVVNALSFDNSQESASVQMVNVPRIAVCGEDIPHVKFVENVEANSRNRPPSRFRKVQLTKDKILPNGDDIDRLHDRLSKMSLGSAKNKFGDDDVEYSSHSKSKAQPNTTSESTSDAGVDNLRHRISACNTNFQSSCVFVGKSDTKGFPLAAIIPNGKYMLFSQPDEGTREFEELSKKVDMEISSLERTVTSRDTALHRENFAAYFYERFIIQRLKRHDSSELREKVFYDKLQCSLWKTMNRLRLNGKSFSFLIDSNCVSDETSLSTFVNRCNRIIPFCHFEVILVDSQLRQYNPITTFWDLFGRIYGELEGKTKYERVEATKKVLNPRIIEKLVEEHERLLFS